MTGSQSPTKLNMIRSFADQDRELDIPLIVLQGSGTDANKVITSPLADSDDRIIDFGSRSSNPNPTKPPK